MNAVSLLEKHIPDPYLFDIVVRHSRLVADKALRIASNLDGVGIDMNFLEEAALLHDIGVCRTASPRFGCHGAYPYIRHGIIGKEILEQEGFPLHALVCERHIGVGLTAEDVRSQRLPLPERDMTPLSLEEIIVCFADLFYSKCPEKICHEKTISSIRSDLARFGDHKVGIFDGWLIDFRYTV
jgi:uncharacterized protein